MPKIAHQNTTWKNPGYQVVRAWPESCTVQWGDRGVVLGPSGGYKTAFFEAFPESGGFFRGEGETLRDAENACWEKFDRFTACDHLWGRGKYTNGGAICRRCGAFKSVFRPITKLGSFKAPLSFLELESAMNGFLRPTSSDDPSMRRHSRKTELRLRLHGVDLPDTPETPQPEEYVLNEDRDPYLRACRDAVASWYRAHRHEIAGARGEGASGLFDSLSRNALDRAIEDEQHA